jgi:type IV secretory pathway VirB10-like protein
MTYVDEEKKPDVASGRNVALAVIVHVLLFAALWFFGQLELTEKELVIPVELTVVVDTPPPPPPKDEPKKPVEKKPEQPKPPPKKEDPPKPKEAVEQVQVKTNKIAKVEKPKEEKPKEEKAASKLSFKEAGKLMVRASAPVQYWFINGMRIETETPVSFLRLRNVTEDLEISVQLAKEEVAPVEVNTAVQCQVSCTGCTFSYLASGLNAVASGEVPSGATVIVMADDVSAVSKGYSINGGAAENAGKTSFRLVITADTTIAIQ